MSPDRIDLWHEGTDSWPDRADFRVERPDEGQTDGMQYIYQVYSHARNM